MALDDSEDDEEEEEQEEEEGTDMESDLEQNKDDGNQAISFAFSGFLVMQTTNMHDCSLQISLTKWPGAPRRSCIMTQTMWQLVRILHNINVVIQEYFYVFFFIHECFSSD